MLNAKEANEQAMKNKAIINNRSFIKAQKEISSTINQKISQGLLEMRYGSEHLAELTLIIDWLNSLGYNVSKARESMYYGRWVIEISWEEKA